MLNDDDTTYILNSEDWCQWTYFPAGLIAATVVKARLPDTADFSQPGLHHSPVFGEPTHHGSADVGV